MHQGRISEQRLVELAPVVVEAAADDAVAAALVDRLADEILAFVRATLPQIGAGDEPVEVVLGGGLLQAPNARLRDAVGVRLAALDPRLRPVVPADPPIVGAALLALEAAGADAAATIRLRASFAEHHAAAVRPRRLTKFGAPVPCTRGAPESVQLLRRSQLSQAPKRFIFYVTYGR